MSDNELSTLENTQLAPSVSAGILSIYDDDDMFKELSGSGGFLPRLQLFGASSGIVKSGQFPMAHYGLVVQKDQIEDLGKEVDVICYARRFKAMDVGGSEMISNFSPDSETFKRIKEMSTEKDSGCMVGNEFLIWLPEKEMFATFYAANASSKQEAPKIWGLRNALATFKVAYKENKAKKQSWHAPLVIASSNVVAAYPTQDELDKQAKIFASPKDSDAEAAAKPASTEGQRDQ